VIQDSDDDKFLIFQNIEAKTGDIITLTYDFDAPDVSPEFYLVGPLELRQDSESRASIFEFRQWQIANDAGVLTYYGPGFTEHSNNEGAVTGEIEMVLIGDTFQDIDTDNILDIGTEVTINNVPAGLTPSIALAGSSSQMAGVL